MEINSLSKVSISTTRGRQKHRLTCTGVAYSSGVATLRDVLVDTNQCQIDAGLMKEMGVNTIRVYTVDNTQNHDGCMQAFDSQGIYVWVDVTTPLVSFNRADIEWTMAMYNNWTVTIDAFAQYDNLLAINVGNEVINDGKTSTSAPFIKAAVRDLKAYRDARGYRKVPISYSSADLLDLRLVTANYLACGDGADTIDLYGMIVYSWCGNSSYYESGYDKLYTEFQDLNIPSLFSETGCNTVSPRDFSEVATMLGTVFPATFSGVVVYEWTQEANDYGLVEYSGSDNTGFPSTLDDYNALKTVYHDANPASTSKAAYTASNSPPSCPTSDSSWLVAPTGGLPTIAALKAETITARTTYTTAAALSTQTSARSPASTSGSSASSSTSSADTKKNSGLSTGAIVGIAIAGALIGIGAILTAYFIIRKRKAARKRQEQELTEKANLGYGGHPSSISDNRNAKSELPAHSAGRIIPKQELEAIERLMQSQGRFDDQRHQPRSKVHEMEGSAPVVNELHSNEISTKSTRS